MEKKKITPMKLMEKVLEESEKKLMKFRNEESEKVNYKSNVVRQEPKPKKQATEKFLMDEHGRVLDEKGNIVQIKPHSVSTLKININKEKEKKVKEMIKLNKGHEALANINDSKFFDPNIDSSKKRRDKMRIRSFNFADEGSYLKNLEDLRKKQESQENPEDNLINAEMMKIKPIFKKQQVKLNALDLIPDVEWWDAYFLPPTKKSFSPYWIRDSDDNWIHQSPSEINFEDFKIDENDLVKEKISSYIQHPVPIRNDIYEKKNNITLPVFLTVKERKKMRRLRRLENEKEKQEKMKLGLIKAPRPKIKFNNFMSILGDQAIQDPTQVEKIVRKEYEKRYLRMLKDNEKRKLTAEQKKDKLKRKYEKDSKKEVKACLFKIENLSSKKNMFRIDRNCQQLYLTGVCILAKKANNNFPNLLYAEGGPLAIKNLKNILLRRITWDESKKDAKGDEEESEEEEDKVKMNDDGYHINSKCLLVWEGNLKNRSFDKWKMTKVKSEYDAKKILADRGLDHYWNLIISYKLED